MIEQHQHPEFDFSKITDEIYIGTNQCCTTHFDERLLRLGITADISVEEKRLDAPFGVEVFLWLPTPDDQAPTSMQLRIGVDTIKNLVAAKTKVYVHCEHGHGRAPTLVAAYLIETRGMSVEEAVKFLQERRPVAHLTDAQIKALKEQNGRKRGVQLNVATLRKL